MSGEHILSAAVLRRIASDKISIAGPQGVRTLSINNSSLKTKRLCKRHNSALGPLDQEAGRLFAAIREIDSWLAADSAPRHRLYLFSAEDIERWLIKTMIMVYHARLTETQPGTNTIPDASPLWLVHGLPPPYGMYVVARQNDGGTHAFRTSHTVSVQLVTYDDQVAGLVIELGGLSIRLVVSGPTEALKNRHVYRPRHINFYLGRRVASLALVSPHQGGSILWLSHGDPDAPIPTDSQVGPSEA